MNTRSSGSQVIAAVAFVGLLLCTGVARAQQVNPKFWTCDPAGRVLAMARSGNTLYLGGPFYAIGPQTGGGVPVSAWSGEPVEPYARVAGEVRAVVPDGEGGWYVGGEFRGVRGELRSNLAHVLRDGSVAAWAPEPDGRVYVLKRVGSRLYVGGEFEHIGGRERHGIAAIDLATGVVTEWDARFEAATVFAIEVHARTVYLGGSVRPGSGFLASVDAESGRVAPWQGNPDGDVAALAYYAGRLYVGGYFWHLGGEARKYLAVVDARTGEVGSWAPEIARVPDIEHYDGGAYVGVLEVHGHTLYVGGSFTVVNGERRGGLAAMDLVTGRLTGWDARLEAIPGLPSPYCHALAVRGGTVYVGGQFYSIGGRTGQRYAGAVDAVSGRLEAWDPRPHDRVYALAMAGDEVYVGGEFTNLWRWEPRYGLAALDATTGELLPWAPSLDGGVQAMVARGNTVYVAGWFSRVGGVARPGLAAVDGTTGEVTSWDPGVQGPLSGSVWSLALGDSTLYVGGWFSRIGGALRSNVAELDLRTGEATGWDPGANDIVESVVVSGGEVYAGGWFSRIGGESRNTLAALDRETGAATGWNPGTDGVVETLAAGNGVLYVGGEFNTLGGKPRVNLGAVELGSGEATEFDPEPRSLSGIYYNNYMKALVVSGNVVYAGGEFARIGGKARSCIAALDGETGEALDWSADADERMWSLAVSGNTVYAGGGFTRIGLRPCAAIAAIEGAPGLAAKPRAAAPAAASEAAEAAGVRLSQVRPNPVRSEAVVRFELARAERVRLEVFDLQGRRVASVLEDAPEEAGAHEVVVTTAGWREGYYLCRLEAGAIRLTRKLIVVH